MKQTNLLLYDLMDLELPESAGDVLWRACKPVAAEERDGAVILKVPYQAQLQKSFKPDEKTAKKKHDLVIRAYGDSIVRITASFAGNVQGDDNVMLEWDSSLMPEPLRILKTETGWDITDTSNTVRMRINLTDKPVKKWGSFSSSSWDGFVHSIPSPPETFEASVFPDGKVEIPFMARDTFFPEHMDSVGLGVIERNGAPYKSLFSLHAKPGEKFAGTGERFAGMNLAGQTMVLENDDAHGVNNRNSYKNVPFYVSNRPYGLLMLTSAHIRLSLAGMSTRAAQALVEDDSLDLFFIGGGSIERVVYNYRRLSGFPRTLPLWSYGTWISRLSYHSADETLDIARRLRKEKYPFEVLHLDPGWFEEFWRCDWEFSKERFPDPEAYMNEMKNMGFRICLWNYPTVRQDTKIYKEACEKGFVPVIKHEDGTEGHGMSIDFSNLEAVEWYKEMLRKVVRQGVAVIKTDFGETIDMNGVYKTIPAKLLHNLNALLYQKAAFEALEEVTGQGIIWARAGWTGCQRYPLHWGGDPASTWDGLAGTIRGGLHIGVSGFAFWGHDIPGHHGIPDLMYSWPEDDLYVRWTQAGVFTSHMRYHGPNPREPYEYPAISALVRKWLQLRYSLIPYFVDEGEKAVRSGYPVFRAMIFHHWDDDICWNVDDQFYCGDSLLVAPVMNSEGVRNVYLPQGSWTDIWTGKVVNGPVMLKGVRMPLERIPVYAKAGSSIRVYPEVVQCTDEMDMAKTVLLTFGSNYKGLSDSILGKVTDL